MICRLVGTKVVLQTKHWQGCWHAPGLHLQKRVCQRGPVAVEIRHHVQVRSERCRVGCQLNPTDAAEEMRRNREQSFAPPISSSGERLTATSSFGCQAIQRGVVVNVTFKV